jgi:hypothetical protein
VHDVKQVACSPQSVAFYKYSRDFVIEVVAELTNFYGRLRYSLRLTV